MENLELIKIKNWIFDPLKKTLMIEDPDGKIIVESLEAKHADLLLCLINHRDEIITRDQLIERVWKNRFVDDRTINATISRLRKVLGGEKDEFIKTHPKLGYSFPPQIEFIARPLPEKIKRTNKERSQFKFYQYLIVISVLCFSTFLWFTLTALDKPNSVLNNNEVDIVPLTYEEGWEFEPSLSFDGKYLAYVGKEGTTQDYKIKIKSLISNETRTLASGVRSPVWSPLSNSLFFAKKSPNGCVVQKVYMESSFLFSQPETITSCGREFDYPTIAIDNNEKWLYFTFKEPNVASVIKRINLNLGTIEPLTLPLQYGGDYQAKLNSNNTHLAFIRTYDNYQSHIFVLDLNTLQVKQITNSEQFPSYMTWGLSPQYLMFVDISNNSLNSIHINTLKVIPIFEYHEQIESPLITNENQVILSVGDSYKSNVIKATLNHDDSQLITSNYIYSTFKDHEVQVIKDKNNEKSFFVSNRSGGYQIWQKSNSVYTQITDFKDKFAEIIELTLSPDKTHLLFKLNEKLHILNLKLNTISDIPHPTKLVGNATWACSSKPTLLISGKKGGDWGLYRFDLTTKALSFLTKDIVNIRSICDGYNYAIVKPNTLGIFLQEDLLDNKSKVKHIFPELNLSENATWDANYHQVLVFRDSKLLTFDMLEQKTKQYSITDYIVNKPRAIGKDIYFNGLEVNNTYIGKFAIVQER